MHELISFVHLSTNDWTMETGGTTLQAINTSMTKWLNGPKSPGLIILEHELDNQTVQAFENAYPLMIQSGWKLESTAQINGSSVYLNSQDSESPVEKVDGVLVQQTYSIPSASSSSGPANPSSTGDGSNAGTNTSQSGNNGSIRSTMSKFAGALGAVFLTVVFYAW